MSVLPWIVLGLAVVLIVLLFVYRGMFSKRSATPPKNFHLSALEALADGDEDLALAELQNAVQSNQGGADAYLRLAEMYRSRGQLKKAIQLHRTLAVNREWEDSIHQRIQRGLAEDYLAAGRWDEALGQLEELRKRDAKDPAVMRRLSQVFLRKGDGDKAQNALKRAHKLEGEDRHDELAILLAELARRQMTDQRWKDARKSLQDAVKQDPNCLPALRLSADLYLHEGKDQEAADETQRVAMTGLPGSEEDYPKMEKLFFDLGRFHEIQFVYQEVLSKAPNFWPARFALAKILEKRGSPDEAVKLLDPAVPAIDAVAGRAASMLLDWNEPMQAAQWLSRWREEPGSGIQKVYRCRNCGTEHARPRWYCASCHGFKSYEPVTEIGEAITTR